jgi:hypothetical protein
LKQPKGWRIERHASSMRQVYRCDACECAVFIDDEMLYRAADARMAEMMVARQLEAHEVKCSEALRDAAVAARKDGHGIVVFNGRVQATQTQHVRTIAPAAAAIAQTGLSAEEASDAMAKLASGWKAKVTYNTRDYKVAEKILLSQSAGTGNFTTGTVGVRLKSGPVEWLKGQIDEVTRVGKKVLATV